MTRRQWRRLDMEDFRAGLRSSSLCSADTWSRFDIDGLAQLYDTEITTVLDGLVPVATVACRRRPSDPWFDDECAAAKREVRRLERAIRQDDSSLDGAATAEWHAARRGYRSLLRRKREEFWRTKIDAESSTPRQLWKSIDVLMGRGSVSEPSTIGPTDFHQFFDAKVAGVRASTANAPSPTFTAVDPGCSFTHFELLTVEDVAAAIRALPDKQCSSDPIATRLREGGRRYSGAILHRAVQQVVDHRIGSFVVQGGIRHTPSEEGRLGSCRCQFVPANLQPVGDVEAVRAAGCETAGGLSNGVRPASETAVGLPCSSLDGNRRSEGHD